ncbi:hypothetical protein PHYPO_G00235240 [Pangasianodon hypophthalmus]|uniref:PLA2c domain-containing protein n=1 Tax=Pangasianodon hypophthalmus TaxID=310915 RepID=A0A5N5NMZ7_PANHP|nr:hypothetical protein PHYPO_G00235240 [Pangasianodon hypophthalmus]
MGSSVLILQDYTRIMSAEECFRLKESEVRIEHSLNKNEEKFAIRRIKTVQQALQKLGIHCSLDQVPNIALLGSGGGERAMVGLLGSLVQLEKAGLLDLILYLSGVSGSTWCMASLYQEPDWSTKLEAVKDKIIKRLSGPAVSWTDAFAKLKKYYYEKDNFSLTDFWAAMVVTTYVKEIDEHTLTEQWSQQSQDPFPIYTVIDKKCKQEKEADPWFEFTTQEAGYSLIGAFLRASSFGSQIEKGSMVKKQPEIDMLFLQALCGSALADGEENVKFIWQKIKDFSDHIKNTHKKMRKGLQCFQDVVEKLVDMNLYVLDGKDPSALHESIRKTLIELTGGEIQQVEKLNLADKEAAKLYMECYNMDVCNNLSVCFKDWPFEFTGGEIQQVEKLNLADKEAAKLYMERYNIDVCNNLSVCFKDSPFEVTKGKIQQVEKLNLADKEAAKLYMECYNMDVCNSLSVWFKLWPFDLCYSILRCMAQWIWGREYDFLHNMTAKAVPDPLLKSEMRDYIDAGLLLNSPYFSVLRKERNVDLIISLDFSDGDPFMTVKKAAEICKEKNIPFPEVIIPPEDPPKDFYVFKGQKVPTVIHIPLFNVVNCGDKIEEWRKKYQTFQGPYSAEMITDLMDVAGKNITNNKENLKKEIRAIVEQKKKKKLNTVLIHNK